MSQENAAGPIDAALIERWASSYLERFPSSAANLRRVLLRRVGGRLPPGDMAAAREASAAIDVLVTSYRESGVVDDVAYAAARTRARLRRGQSLSTIRAGLAAKGVAAADTAAAIASLDRGESERVDPDLAAACAFARRRRLGPFRRAPVERARELAAFARAGFSRTIAEAILACADPDAVAALLGGEN